MARWRYLPGRAHVESDDYCDVCGMPIDAAPVRDAGRRAASAARSPPLAPAPAGRGRHLPELRHRERRRRAFCEACGYDFTTGTMPRPLRAAGRGRAGTAPAGRTAVATGAAGAAGRRRDGRSRRSRGWPRSGSTRPGTTEQESPDPLPSPGLPASCPLPRSVAPGRPALEEPQHPPRRRLRARLRGEPAAGAADDRRHAAGGSRTWSRRTARSSGPASGPLPDGPDPRRAEARARGRRPGLRRRLDEDRRAEGDGGRGGGRHVGPVRGAPGAARSSQSGGTTAGGEARQPRSRFTGFRTRRSCLTTVAACARPLPRDSPSQRSSDR